MIKNLSKKIVLVVLFILGMLLHLFYLSYPGAVIFDEVHFGKFITSYLWSHQSIFDIHPPHAKLLIAFVAKLGGYQGNFGFDKIGDSYGTVPIFSLRLLPAIWGIGTPIAFFSLALQLGASTAIAFLGSLFLVFDNALLLQTRVIALDGLLLLSILMSLSFFLMAIKSVSFQRRTLFFILCGVSAGFAVGTKFTGLSIFPLLLFLAIEDHFKKRTQRERIESIRQWVWIAFGFCFVYLGGWILHFELLSLPGPGDAFYRTTGNFFRDLPLLHRVMLVANSSLQATHSHASSWFGWPLMHRPVFYWVQGEAMIYFLGNPVVWWGSLLGLIFAFRSLFLKTSRKKTPVGQSVKLWFPIAGYIVSFAPYIPIHRPLFLYHYLPPLTFSVLATTLWLEKSLQKKGSLARHFNRAFLAIILIILMGFFFISPLTYGFSCFKTPSKWIFTLLPNWR